MNNLDKKFKFRDTEKFKTFNKVFLAIVILCFVAVMALVCIYPKDKVRLFVFLMLPLLTLFSFFRKNDYLFILAEIVTIIADIFLILLKKVDIGFPIYLVVQLIYGTYFYFRDPNKYRRITVAIIRPYLMAIAVLAAYVLLQNKFSLKMAFGVMYFVNILVNVLYAIILKDPLLIVGFIIFAVSDLFIGLSMIVTKGPVIDLLNKFNLVYFLYLISQLVLVFNKRNNNYQRVETY